MKNPHLAELGQFLKARRGDLAPDDLGLPARDAGIRRVAGLRREEVAQRVAISHDYYTRIEQGRLAPSQEVLAAIAHTLRLIPEQREYVENLARQAERRTPPQRRVTPVRPQLQRLLDRLTDTPAMVAGKYLDILAWNDLAAALLGDPARIPAHQRNYVRMMYTDPAMKDRYPDWEALARTGVAVLRMHAADNPDDPRLAALVGELSVTNALFRRWWATRHVAHPEFGAKTIRHPELGDLTLDWDAFSYAGDPDQQLVLWSAEPGTSAYDKLRILAARYHAPTPPTADEPND